MAIYGYLWLSMAIYGYLWLGYLWLCMVIYGYLCLFVAFYGYFSFLDIFGELMMSLTQMWDFPNNKSVISST